jgi:exo-beta-1,3-glucanase (GH17 family)
MCRYCNGKKVIITETGWPSKGDEVAEAFPTKENAMRFFINIQKWSEEEDVELLCDILFYFNSNS